LPRKWTKEKDKRRMIEESEGVVVTEGEPLVTRYGPGCITKVTGGGSALDVILLGDKSVQVSKSSVRVD